MKKFHRLRHSVNVCASVKRVALLQFCVQIIETYFLYESDGNIIQSKCVALLYTDSVGCLFYTRRVDAYGVLSRHCLASSHYKSPARPVSALLY